MFFHLIIFAGATVSASGVSLYMEGIESVGLTAVSLEVFNLHYIMYTPTKIPCFTKVIRLLHVWSWLQADIALDFSTFSSGGGALVAGGVLKVHVVGDWNPITKVLGISGTQIGKFVLIYICYL